MNPRLLFFNALKSLSERGKSSAYHRLYKSMISAHPELGKPLNDENEWLKRWGRYDNHLKPYAYRIFGRYVGNDQNIVPLEVVQNIVEPVLTPISFSEYYSDKNMVAKILPRDSYKQCVPHVFLRNIGGLFYDEFYTPLSNDEAQNALATISEEKVIVKPSRLSSGVGVKVFRKAVGGGIFIDGKGNELTIASLCSDYGKDFLIQEVLEQSDFLSSLNPSSVNTIRIAVYRDKTGGTHHLGSILRIGASGSDVDNAHAGGRFCGINDDGILGKCTLDALGGRQTVFNGFDFEHTHLQIPGFDSAVKLALSIAPHLLHHRLIAFDIAISKDGTPKLIEYNVYGFSAWLFQFTKGGVFGKFTEEIMEECTSELKTYRGQIIVVPC